MENKAFEWTGGAFVHNHSRIDNLVEKKVAQGEITPEMAMYLKRYKDGSFSLKAISTYLTEMFGEKILVTDTQHPAYVLDDNYENLSDQDKVKYFKTEAIEKTVDLLTRCILERMKLVSEQKDLSNVLTGVEADILPGKGRMTVDNRGLSQLDYVSASFHSSIWRAAGYKDPNSTECLDMYHYIVDNQNVDVISHPTYYIPQEVKRKMTAQDWTELLQNMKEREVAFEINLDSTNLVYERGGNLDRNVILQAMKTGTPLVIGFDFHNASDWGAYPSPELTLTEDEAKKLFREHMENGSTSRLLAKVMGNISSLEEMGLCAHDILNSKEDKFIEWLIKRNVTR